MTFSANARSHRMGRRSFLASIGAAIASSALSHPALAQADAGWPNKFIRLIVGFPAGGQSDIMARVIGESMSARLGQPVIIENKGGASGLIAADFVSKQKPDGYTMMLTSESLQSRAAAVYKKLPYDPINGFSPIGKFAKQRTLMVVNSSSSIKSVKEFIEYARAHPGKLNFGATYSTSSQFGGALFQLNNKIEMFSVNYPGGAQPITDLLAGVVDVGFFVESTVAQHVQSGKLRALACASSDRSDLFPDIPTMAEAGAAPMDVSPWFGLVFPAGISPAILEKTSTALRGSLDDPSLKKRLNTIGAVSIEGSSPATFSADLLSETEYWKKFVKDTNFPLID